jgi:hypothetical protein
LNSGLCISFLILKQFFKCLSSFKSNNNTAGSLWLKPVILATQEAEIRRIVVQNQSRQIVHKTLSQKTHHKNRLVGWLKVFSTQHRQKKKSTNNKHNMPYEK